MRSGDGVAVGRAVREAPPPLDRSCSVAET